jgi:cytoskeleton protein RodZ
MSADDFDASRPASPGARLRRERELRGLTGQQAAEQMNLDLAVIEALEADDFAALGAPVFAKGHLRKYAALLGVADADLLSGYEKAQAKPDSPTLVPRARLEMQPERAKPRWPWAVGSLLVFLLAAAVVAWLSDGAPGLGRLRATIGLGDAASDGDAAGTAPSAVMVGSESASPVVTAVPDTAPPLATATAEGTDPAAATGTTQLPAGATAAAQPPSAAASAPVPGQVALQMRFAVDSWVEVYDASGKAVLYDLGRAGSERVVSGRPPLNVTLGNAPAVTLRVNDKPVAIPRPTAGTVSRFNVAADGSLR